MLFLQHTVQNLPVYLIDAALGHPGLLRQAIVVLLYPHLQMARAVHSDEHPVRQGRLRVVVATNLRAARVSTCFGRVIVHSGGP